MGDIPVQKMFSEEAANVLRARMNSLVEAARPGTLADAPKNLLWDVAHSHNIPGSVPHSAPTPHAAFTDATTATGLNTAPHPSFEAPTAVGHPQSALNEATTVDPISGVYNRGAGAAPSASRWAAGSGASGAGHGRFDAGRHGDTLAQVMRRAR